MRFTCQQHHRGESLLLIYLDVFGVEFFLWGVGGGTEQLPYDGPKVLGHTHPDQVFNLCVLFAPVVLPVVDDVPPFRPTFLFACIFHPLVRRARP